jgi:hypothetical protein
VRQGILDMAFRLLAPSYVEDPAAQLRLVTPATLDQAAAHGGAHDGAHDGAHGGAHGGAGKPRPEEPGRAASSSSMTAPRCGTVDAATRAAVQTVALEDSEHEAEFVVDEILRIRARAVAAAKAAAKAASDAGDAGRARTLLAAPPPSIAILYRTNAQSMPFERRLVRARARSLHADCLNPTILPSTYSLRSPSRALLPCSWCARFERACRTSSPRSAPSTPARRSATLWPTCACW